MRRWMAILLASAGAALLAPGQTGTTSLASATAGGVAGDGLSDDPRVTPDGRYVAFDSHAKNLSAVASTTGSDVYVRDLWTGALELVSVSATGGPANSSSFSASISADGRFVAFVSRANNLIPAGGPFVANVFLRDRALGTTIRVTETTGGGPTSKDSYLPAISADGAFVAYDSFDPDIAPGDFSGRDVFVWERATGVSTLVSKSYTGGPADQESRYASISADGSWIAYTSSASNLVPGGTNGTITNLYLTERASGATELVSVDPSGLAAGGVDFFHGVSRTGRYVAFQSDAPNLVAGDTNGTDDVFLRDRLTGTTRRVSVSSTGAEGDGPSWSPSLTANARWIGFSSLASNLVPLDGNADWDAFVHDLSTGTTRRVSVTSLGAEGSGAAVSPVVVAQAAKLVSFSSTAPLAGEANGVEDVFVHELGVPPISVHCESKTNSLGCAPAIGAAGSPSATLVSGFHLQVDELRNRKSGLFLYTKQGAQQVPFQGGLLCLRAPLRMVGPQSTGGSPLPAADCTGAASFDFNAWVATGNDPGLVPGQTIDAQFYSRDPGFAVPNATSLSDAVTFTLEP